MRALFFVLTAFCCLTLSADTPKKVVVIGFDGADYKIVKQLLDEEQLPNLKKLGERGGFAALTPTNPPQTPVSWSTFATGINPGRTGIFDFIKRKENSYLADFALRGESTKQVAFGANNRYIFPAILFLLLFDLIFFLTRKRIGNLYALAGGALIGFGFAGAAFWVVSNWLPEQMPAVETVRKGKPIWTILEEQGKSAKIIRLPITFPAEKLNGEMISDLAVPDIRGTVGKPSIYSNDPDWKPGANQFSVEVYALEGASPYQTSLLGPPNKLFYDASEERQYKLAGKAYPHPKDFHLPMTIETSGESLTIGVSEQKVTLKAKEWSRFVTFEYKVNPIIKLKGFGRFYLDHLKDGKFKLYLSPINLHPEVPMPMSYPQELAQEVWEREPYKTIGWAEDTWAISSGLMDEDHFLQDIELTVTRFEAMMEEFLKGNQSDLYVQVFSFTDRVAHVLFRFWDEGHPLYDPVRGPKYQQAIRDAYKRMDAIVGRAMDLVDLEKTAFIVCSDHGFASWRYQFSTNTFLQQKGYLTLKSNVLGQPMQLDDLQTGSSPFQYVDWSKTQAYALGLGQVFINLKGREPEGSVDPSEYDALCKRIAADLESYVDESTGLKPISKVYFRDQMYRGYDPKVTPDLRAANAPLYRVSWDTTLGGMPKQITEINPQNWSGDHCSLAPEDVQGILFSSIPLKKQNPQMADLCPSLLALLGVKTEEKLDGESLF